MLQIFFVKIVIKTQCFKFDLFSRRNGVFFPSKGRKHSKEKVLKINLFYFFIRWIVRKIIKLFAKWNKFNSFGTINQ